MGMGQQAALVMPTASVLHGLTGTSSVPCHCPDGPITGK